MIKKLVCIFFDHTNDHTCKRCGFYRPKFVDGNGSMHTDPDHILRKYIQNGR